MINFIWSYCQLYPLLHSVYVLIVNYVIISCFKMVNPLIYAVIICNLFVYDYMIN